MTFFWIELIRRLVGFAFLAIIAWKVVWPFVQWIRNDPDGAVARIMVYFGFRDDEDDK